VIRYGLGMSVGYEYFWCYLKFLYYDKLMNINNDWYMYIEYEYRNIYKWGRCYLLLMNDISDYKYMLYIFK
jgi:hypothetical protein